MNIQQPTLLLDSVRCRHNLRRMHDKAHSAGVGFRPHFKTHQSRAVAEWFRAEGIERISVASLSMAEYFADAGWDDILIAFPLNPLSVERYNALAQRIRLATLVDHPDALKLLANQLTEAMGIYLDIDAGYGRTGVPIGNIDRLERLLEGIRQLPQMTFRGFYCHAGDTYHHTDPDRRLDVQARALEGLDKLNQHFAAEQPLVLMGDTPGCSLADSFPGVDEITPGNFIFYDLFQASIGSCTEEDIAVALACPVVGHYPDRGEVVIHGGSVHFSKDALDVGGRRVFGKLAKPTDQGWEPMDHSIYLDSVSQEHGIIRLPPDLLKETNIGDVLTILPVHSCLTAQAMGEYMDLQGQKLDHLAGASNLT